jgi:CTP:molybdopterin cytidylyltransferase MocA
VKEVAAILLAAGRSRRMGAFKPLLPFGDRTVIECCIKNLRDAGIGEIIVVLGHRAEELRQHLQGDNVSFVVNPNPDSEMSVSIARGIERVNKDALAVIIGLVDHPAVSPETIGILIQEWKAGAKLVQPEHQGRGGHPVLVDLDYRAQLLNLDPKQGLRALFEAHRTEVRRVPVASPFVARDMDTWDDYCTLHQAVFGRKPEEIRW